MTGNRPSLLQCNLGVNSTSQAVASFFFDVFVFDPQNMMQLIKTCKEPVQTEQDILTYF